MRIPSVRQRRYIAYRLKQAVRTRRPRILLALWREMNGR